MGFFSWITQDTNRSIANQYCENQNCFRVIMTDNQNRQWVETEYEGYGEFGGKDYYQLLAEMNMVDPQYHTRDVGIDLEFSPERVTGERKHRDVIYPSLSESGQYFNGDQPESCPDQGIFYADDCYSYDDCSEDY